jgi:hypothetical protein
VVNFARVRLTDYDRSSENRISARILGYAAYPNANLIPRPVLFKAVLTGLSRTLVTIQAVIPPVLPSRPGGF